jgi:iron(III) transport system ATP-binding protein
LNPGDAPLVSTGVQAPLTLRGLRKSYGKVPAVRGIDLDVAGGTITSLIGPSGCGKTTTLRMIAGLEAADAGVISVGDRTLTDGPRSTPPELRDMGMVFQSYALWPHMTVERNVGYGLERRKRPRDEIRTAVSRVLQLVGLGELGDRYPGQLSGGQQQRVALARAIATEPSILLFDEPLSNLDAVLREQMRFEIRSLQQRLGITAVYVTHSQDEALVLSDRIAVMHDGVVVQTGAPQDVYNRPRTEFVATFIGLSNILSVEVYEVAGEAVGATLDDGTRIGAVSASDAVPRPGQRAKISLRPTDIRIDSVRTSAANVVHAVVETVAFSGGLVDYFMTLRDAPSVRLRVQSTPPLTAQPGDSVVLHFDADRAVVLES